MATVPHDVPDLYLAPVVLAVDARIEELGRLDIDRFTREVALESNSPDWSRKMREDALNRAIQYLVDCHDWTFSWDARGLRMSHAAHTLVLGIPPVFTEYLSSAPRS